MEVHLRFSEVLLKLHAPCPFRKRLCSQLSKKCRLLRGSTWELPPSGISRCYSSLLSALPSGDRRFWRSLSGYRRCAADAALPKAPAAAPDSVAIGVFRRGARRWGSPRRKTPEAAVHVSAILEPEGDSERRVHLSTTGRVNGINEKRRCRPCPPSGGSVGYGDIRAPANLLQFLNLFEGWSPSQANWLFACERGGAGDVRAFARSRLTAFYSGNHLFHFKKI